MNAVLPLCHVWPSNGGTNISLLIATFSLAPVRWKCFNSPYLLCFCLGSAGVLFLDGSTMWTRGQRDNSCCTLSRPPAFASRRASISALEVQSCALKVQNRPPFVHWQDNSMVCSKRRTVCQVAFDQTWFLFSDNSGAATEASGCGNIWMTPSKERMSPTGELEATWNFLSTLKDLKLKSEPPASI